MEAANLANPLYWLEKAIDGAKQLGALDSCSIWALSTLVLLAYIIWDIKLKRGASERAWNARLAEAKADELLANALDKIHDELKELRQNIRYTGDVNAEKD